MIYDKIATAAGTKVAALKAQREQIQKDIDATMAAIRVEDSKRREAELKTQLSDLQRARLQNYYEIEAVETDAFKDLLATHYELPRTHPKFDKVFALAWEYGHSAGYSEVEIYFSNFVDLVR